MLHPPRRPAPPYSRLMADLARRLDKGDRLKVAEASNRDIGLNYGGNLMRIKVRI